MRFKVMYDDLVDKWAVVDTKAAGLAIGFHDIEEDARNAALGEEERWYKCFSPNSKLPTSLLA